MATQIADALAAASNVYVCAVTLLEANLVLIGDPPAARERLAAVLKESQAVIVPFEAADAKLAYGAAATFGKGRHPAALNFGDCAVYALAKRLDAPLLFIGEDFSRTDLKAALPAQSTPQTPR